MIGFDIGGTKCAVSTGHIEGENLVIDKRESFLTEHDVSPYAIIERMCTLAESMSKDMSKIGISCGGPLDSRKGVILSPPNLPGWDQVEIVSYLKERYNGDVFLQNDANACAYAEWKYGAGKGSENMIFLTFGSGMGAGLILNNQLYCGTSDMAGEVGHIRLAENGPVGFGKAGSFEGFCSGNGIAQIGKTLALEALQMGEKTSYCESYDTLEFVTAKEIAKHALAGCEDAKKVYRISAEKLGYALSILIDILNPDAIVIGSVFQRSETLFREIMENVIENEALTYARTVCRIVPAALGDNIGDYAALSLASM